MLANDARIVNNEAYLYSIHRLYPIHHHHHHVYYYYYCHHHHHHHHPFHKYHYHHQFHHQHHPDLQQSHHHHYHIVSAINKDSKWLIHGKLFNYVVITFRKLSTSIYHCLQILIIHITSIHYSVCIFIYHIYYNCTWTNILTQYKYASSSFRHNHYYHYHSLVYVYNHSTKH